MPAGHLDRPFSPEERLACQRAYVRHQGLIRTLGRRLTEEFRFLDKATVYSCVDVAFLKAFRAHDERKGKFSTIFVTLARYEIKHCIRDSHNLIRLPQKKHYLLVALWKHLANGLTLAQAAERLACPADELIELARMAKTPTSFNDVDDEEQACPRPTPMQLLDSAG